MDYDIKRGWFKNIEGNNLAQLMEDVFGNVTSEGSTLVSSFGVLDRIEVKVLSKEQLDITTVNGDRTFSDEEIIESKRKLNEFAEKATGFNAKARMKRAQDKAKKGTL